MPYKLTTKHFGNHDQLDGIMMNQGKMAHDHMKRIHKAVGMLQEMGFHVEKITNEIVHNALLIRSEITLVITMADMVTREPRSDSRFYVKSASYKDSVWDHGITIMDEFGSVQKKESFFFDEL